MQIDKRSFLKLAAGGAALATMSVPARAATDKIRMGYIADYFGTSMVAIATAKGFWAKHGLEADLKVFTNGPIQVQALGAGSLDFAYIGPGALWLPASGHAKIIAVNWDANAPIFSFAHYGIVGDLNQVVPKMIAAVKARA